MNASGGASFGVAMSDQTVSTDPKTVHVMPKGFEGLRLLAEFLVRAVKYMGVDLFSITIDGYDVGVKKSE